MALEIELQTYKSKLYELRADEGKFALVHGRDIDVYGTYEDALTEGYKRYRLEPFMVKKIEVIEQRQYITRLDACRI